MEETSGPGIRQNQRSVDFLIPLSEEAGGSDSRQPDAWTDSDIRRLLVSSTSSPSFCSIDHAAGDCPDRIQRLETLGGLSHVSRYKWRSLVRKLKTHHQQARHHREVGDDNCDDTFVFQHRDLQSSPKEMEMETSPLNLGRSLDGDGQSVISVQSQDCHLQDERNPWNWRNNNSADVPSWETPMDCHPTALRPTGRVISIKWGDVTRKVGIDGSRDAIKDAIRSVFRLRTRRTFWLEDENGAVRGFDRTMPETTYTLHTGSEHPCLSNI